MIKTPTVDDLIPKVRPEYGVETARLVLDIVTRFPELHDQYDFEREKSCGTTRCIAGWAQFIHRGHVDGYVESDAQHFLRLSYDDADRLFYTLNDAAAVRALEYLARGEPIDWDAVEAGDVV